MKHSPSLLILCVEDEPTVLDAVIRDLAPFEEHFRLEAASSAAEARTLLDSLLDEDHRLALALCDHLMPGLSGTDFLIQLNQADSTRPARKLLLTAQAGLDDTVRAVNQANLDHYLAKPWQPDHLQATVRDQLTSYVIDQRLDPLPYLAILDSARLAETIRRRNILSDG